MDASPTASERSHAQTILAAYEDHTDPAVMAAMATRPELVGLARAMVRGWAVPTERGTAELALGAVHVAHAERYGVLCPTDLEPCHCETESYALDSVGLLQGGEVSWRTVIGPAPPSRWLPTAREAIAADEGVTHTG